MSRHDEIVCDNSQCKGGKYMHRCNGGHDICSLCIISLEELCPDENLKQKIIDAELRIYFCPICLEKAKVE